MSNISNKPSYMAMAAKILSAQLIDPVTNQYINPIPIDRDFNSDKLTRKYNRGIVMFHGSTHRKPDIPAFISPRIKWETADINPQVQPTHIINFEKIEQLKRIGYYKYSIDYHGPTGAYPNFIIYLYNMRQIQPRGGLIIFRYGFLGLGNVMYKVRYVYNEKLSLPKIMNLYKEYLNLLVKHCGCSGFEWYDLDSNRTITSIDKSMYRIDKLNNTPICHVNIMLVVRI